MDTSGLLGKNRSSVRVCKTIALSSFFLTPSRLCGTFDNSNRPNLILIKEETSWTVEVVPAQRQAEVLCGTPQSVCFRL